MKAITFNLLAWVMLPIMDGFAKYLSADLPVLQITWARYFFTVVFTLPIMFFFFRENLVWTDKPKLQFIRGLILLTANICFFYAISVISLAKALTLAFVAPLGAGRGVHKKFKKKNLYESLSAYGVGFHRHNSEIHQELSNYTSSKIDLTFTPHIIPMFRGILSTIYLDLKPGTTLNKVQNILKKFHKKNKFVKIKSINSFLSTNDVMNTNYCFISVCKTKFKDKIIILSAIDNLIKGGAGQAVQNMNLKFGYKISEGLL